jgi:hypothetical protein
LPRGKPIAYQALLARSVEFNQRRESQMIQNNWWPSCTAAFTVAVAVIASSPSVHAQQLASTSAARPSPGIDALQQAARDGKYLFVFFWKQNDQQTQSMQGVFQDATRKMTSVADSTAVQITDPENAPIVKQFAVSRAPMPLVVAIAPNGAVTKGLPVSFNEKQLQDAIVSRGTATCLKALQDRKLVLLCVKNDIGSSAFEGVHQFAQDSRFAAASEIVSVSAADPSEEAFLRSLKIDPAGHKSLAVVLTPPGQPVATFAENATKDQIVERLTAASSSCCPGGKCGPGGCGPGQKCGPGQVCGPGGCQPQ